MTYLKNKVYPKIDWASLYKSDNVDDGCLEGFDLCGDNVLACYNGSINPHMINHLTRVLKNSGYEHKLLMLATTEFNKMMFINMGYESIYCHKTILETEVQNFEIQDTNKIFDLISISRESKRVDIGQYLPQFKWCSLTWDQVHYPDPRHFDYMSNRKLSYTEISNFINICRYGYFVADGVCECGPPILFWLCGVPVVTKLHDRDDGLVSMCEDFNCHNLMESTSIDMEKKWDAHKIRNHALGIIWDMRYELNNKIDELQMNTSLCMEMIEDINSLPKW